MKLTKVALADLLAVPVIAGIPTTGYAEPAPGCSSLGQIGTTAHIYSGGTTFVSVKQFVGCGKNWAYLYVWAGYRSTHSSWNACVAIGDNNTHLLEGTSCGSTTEIWSFAADTVAHCTQAIGWIPDGPSAKTSERC